jgi:hypothetical protein
MYANSSKKPVFRMLRGKTVAGRGEEVGSLILPGYRLSSVWKVFLVPFPMKIGIQSTLTNISY